MNVLSPISTGGERASEPQYTSTEWDLLSPAEREKTLIDIGSAESGICFEFTGDEGRRLRNEGRFNGPEIGGYAEQLLGVKTRTFVDNGRDTMVQLLGQFRQDTSHPLPNGTVVGTIFPRQLTRVLDRVLAPKPQ